MFFKKAFALLAKGPCIPFTGKWYLTGCCPKKTPNMFLITKNQEIFLLSKEKKKAHEGEMLIFHPDISPFPKPALKKRGLSAPSSP